MPESWLLCLSPRAHSVIPNQRLSVFQTSVPGSGNINNYPDHCHIACLMCSYRPFITRGNSFPSAIITTRVNTCNYAHMVGITAFP